MKEVNASKREDEDINKYRFYLTSNLKKDLAPGDTNTVTITTSKILTSTDDNTFNNKSEIAKVEKNKEGLIGTPIKLINNYFSIGDSEEIVIIPSTGENRNNVLPIAVGIATITILGVGIILIKKYAIE